MSKKAFSFIEFLIILSVILILFYINIPRLFFVNKFIVQSEVEKIYTVFTYVSQKAITTNQEQDIVFDLKNNSYSYNQANSDKEVTIKISEKVFIGFLPGSKGPPSSPTKPINNAITFEKVNENQYKVHFFVDGKIKPGTIYFVDKDLKFMYCITCSVSQVSYIRKYRYDNGVWVCLN